MALSAKEKTSRLNSLIGMLLFFSLAGVTGVYLVNRTQTATQPEKAETPQSEATLSIKKVHHKATKNGLKQWDLTADTADYYKDKNEIRFHQIKVLFFLKNEESITLTADQSTLYTESNDMHISGDIVAISENGTLKTETLQYTDNQHIITGNMPVELSGETFKIDADSMVLHLDTKRTEFLGNVKGEFIEGRK
jgi:LPS export ABC transporter protein LptC